MANVSHATKHFQSPGAPESSSAKKGKTLPSYSLEQKMREHEVLIKRKIAQAEAEVNKARALNESQKSEKKKGKEKQIDVSLNEGDERRAREAFESGMKDAEGVGEDEDAEGENESQWGGMEDSFAMGEKGVGIETIIFPPIKIEEPSESLSQMTPPNNRNSYCRLAGNNPTDPRPYVGLMPNPRWSSVPLQPQGRLPPTSSPDVRRQQSHEEYRAFGDIRPFGQVNGQQSREEDGSFGGIRPLGHFNGQQSREEYGAFGNSHFPWQMNGSQSSGKFLDQLSPSEFQAPRSNPLPPMRRTVPGSSESAKSPKSAPDPDPMTLPTEVDSYIMAALRAMFRNNRLEPAQVFDTVHIDHAASTIWQFTMNQSPIHFAKFTALSSQWSPVKLSVLAKMNVLPSWWWYREQVIVALKPKWQLRDPFTENQVRDAVAYVLARERLRSEGSRNA